MNFASRETALLALIEFTGIAQDYNVRSVVRDIPGIAVLSVDPLDVGRSEMASHTERAQVLAERIAERETERVAIIASCAGASLIGHIAAQLESLGISVIGAAALDPVRISEDVVNEELHEIADGFGCVLPEVLAPGGRARGEMISGAEKILATLVDKYMASSPTPVDCDYQSLLGELLNRYTSWISFLICSSEATEDNAYRAVDVFASEERMPAVDVPYAGHMHTYKTQGEPCLRNPQCASDIHYWCLELLKD